MASASAHKGRGMRNLEWDAAKKRYVKQKSDSPALQETIGEGVPAGSPTRAPLDDARQSAERNANGIIALKPPLIDSWDNEVLVPAANSSSLSAQSLILSPARDNTASGFAQLAGNVPTWLVDAAAELPDYEGVKGPTASVGASGVVTFSHAISGRLLPSLTGSAAVVPSWGRAVGPAPDVRSDQEVHGEPQERLPAWLQSGASHAVSDVVSAPVTGPAVPDYSCWQFLPLPAVAWASQAETQEGQSAGRVPLAEQLPLVAQLQEQIAANKSQADRIEALASSLHQAQGEAATSAHAAERLKGEVKAQVKARKAAEQKQAAAEEATKMHYSNSEALRTQLSSASAQIDQLKAQLASARQDIQTAIDDQLDTDDRLQRAVDESANLRMQMQGLQADAVYPAAQQLLRQLSHNLAVAPPVIRDAMMLTLQAMVQPHTADLGSTQQLSRAPAAYGGMSSGVGMGVFDPVPGLQFGLGTPAPWMAPPRTTYATPYPPPWPGQQGHGSGWLVSGPQPSPTSWAHQALSLLGGAASTAGAPAPAGGAAVPGGALPAATPSAAAPAAAPAKPVAIEPDVSAGLREALSAAPSGEHRAILYRALTQYIAHRYPDRRDGDMVLKKAQNGMKTSTLQAVLEDKARLAVAVDMAVKRADREARRAAK